LQISDEEHLSLTTAMSDDDLDSGRQSPQQSCPSQTTSAAVDGTMASEQYKAATRNCRGGEDVLVGQMSSNHGGSRRAIYQLHRADSSSSARGIARGRAALQHGCGASFDRPGGFAAPSSVAGETTSSAAASFSCTGAVRKAG
jgi:hypothetical protein